MTTSDDDAPPEQPTWKFVPLADHAPPQQPAASAAADAWLSFRRLLGAVAEDAQAPVKAEDELRSLPEVRLAHLVPPLDWDSAALALDSALGEPEDPSRWAHPVRLVIGQPFAGHAATLRRWAAKRDAAVIEAPPRLELLAGQNAWRSRWPADGRLWVLPALEHWYLRHARGLSLVRELLEAAHGGALGAGVIACDGWAWAYLQRVWPVSRPDALTLQAFDGPRLARLLADMVAARSRRRVLFRNARTGSDVLVVPGARGETGAELRALAAHCRGNVGTALCYWRERLRAMPDSGGEAEESAAAEKASATEDGEETVWVSATRSDPVPPSEKDEDTAFVLHALLLHGGLPASLLPELLPLAPHRCTALLHRLQQAGLVTCRDGDWYVTELAYAAVRALLRGRDYLTDPF